MAPTNALTCYGNEKTMNLNSMLLTNIQSSPYFKVNLFELKTYHEVIDELFYKVSHMEPWEKGSRKTSGQTGMCGGVRGVGAGGIVSSAFCLLYKLFTLKLTRKQVTGLITHVDSPYIRAVGFMYIRYTQNPADLWEWFEEYLEDDEELDVKAGGGHTLTVGEMLRQWLLKLEWYSTLFPRIPVPIQKQLAARFEEWDATHSRPIVPPQPLEPPAPEEAPSRVEDRERNVDRRRDERRDDRRGDRGGERKRGDESSFGEAGRVSHLRGESPHRSGSESYQRKKKERSAESHRDGERERSRRDDHRHQRSRSREKKRSRSKERKRSRSPQRERHQHSSHGRSRHGQKRSRSRDRTQRRSRSRERDYQSSQGRESSFERDCNRERQRQSRMKESNGK